MVIVCVYYSIWLVVGGCQQEVVLRMWTSVLTCTVLKNSLRISNSVFWSFYTPSCLPHFPPHHLPTWCPCPVCFIDHPFPPPTHTHWICLVLTIHSCTPYSNMVSLPGTTLFKKTELFFPWSHQLSIALLQLGVGACELLPNQCWMLIGLFLSSSFVGKQSCCKFVSAVFLSCPEDAVLSWSSMTSSTCNPSTPSSTMVPEPCGRGMV